MAFPIKYVSHDEIDKLKWDACIATAHNGLIYAYADYLDAMTPDWEALVMSDYEAVFPLPQRTKWGIHYLFQPLLTAQLGLFGNHLSEELLNAFLAAIPPKFRYLDLPLNAGNRFSHSHFPLFKRCNLVLSLQPSYEQLYGQYNQNTKRNIKKAIQHHYSVRRGIEVDSIIELAKAQIKDNVGLQRFKSLYTCCRKQDKAVTYGVYNSAGQLLASAAFLFSHQRAYYILVGNHHAGVMQGASHLLIDSFIRDHAGTPLLLDFEGSDVPGVAFFYRGFGAVEEAYPALRYNRLPLPLRWLKD